MSLREKRLANKVYKVEDFNQDIPRLDELVKEINEFVGNVNPFGEKDVKIKPHTDEIDKKPAVYKFYGDILVTFWKDVYITKTGFAKVDLKSLRSKKFKFAGFGISQSLFETRFLKDDDKMEYESSFVKEEDIIDNSFTFTNNLGFYLKSKVSNLQMRNECYLDLTSGKYCSDKDEKWNDVTEENVEGLIVSLQETNNFIKGNILDKICEPSVPVFNESMRGAAKLANEAGKYPTKDDNFTDFNNTLNDIVH